MKRTILIIVSIFTISVLNAQIEIHLENSGPNIAGTIHEINANEFTPYPLMPQFFITNNTGIDQKFRITRVKQNVPSAWNDQLYWPTAGYPANGDVYTTPNTIGSPAPTILNGTNFITDGSNAILQPYITPDGNNNVAMYMYYVTDSIGNYLDSIGVRVNYVLSVEEKTEAKMSVSPNPANTNIHITSEGLHSGKLTIIDVLGNTVLMEEITNSTKTLDISTFRNGIYFVRLESENHKTTTRKLVIKH